MGVLVASAHHTACREAQALSSCAAEQDLDRGASWPPGLLLFAEGELLLQTGMAWPSGAVSGRPGHEDTHSQGALGKGRTTAAFWGDATLICTLLSRPR